MSRSGEPFDPYHHWLGIPPDEQPPDHYRLLGIQPWEENREVIRNAADRQMVHLRTFQCGPQAALSEKLLNEVAAARICLLSPDKKAAYDSRLRQSMEPPSRPPSAAEPPALAPSIPAAPKTPLAPVPASPPVVVSPSVGPEVSERRLPRRRASWWPVIALAVVAVPGLAWTLFVVQRWQASAPMAGAATPVPGRLVLNWRSSDRRDATLEIDGRFVDLATALMSDSEALEFQLAPGAHEFCIARAASQPLRRRFTMEPGARFVVDVVFTPTPTGATLVLVWPQSAREGALLEIDGRAYDLNDAAVDAAGDRIRVSLPVGQHAVRVSRHGETLVERVVTLGMTTPTTLSIGPPLAKLLLRWRAENRKGVVLLLDDRPIDLPASRAADDATTLQLDVPAGRATLTVKRDESALESRRISLAPGRPTVLDVDAWLERATPRLVLLWPGGRPPDATLQVDGQQQPWPDGDPAVPNEWTLAMEPGEHAIRITVPGHAPWERQVTLRDGELRVSVSVRKPIAVGLPPNEEHTLRKQFTETYTQFEEYRRWQGEKDPPQKREALQALLVRMTSAAENMKEASAEQYVAYDETYRLALHHKELAAAQAAARRLQLNGCISEEDAARRGREMWDQAIETAELDDMMRSLEALHRSTGQPTPAQVERIGQRLSQSPLVVQGYRAFEARIRSLVDLQILSARAGDRVWADVLLRAAASGRPDPAALVELAERMLEVIPKLLNDESGAGLHQAVALSDAWESHRREVLGDRRSSAALRARVEKVQETAQELQEQITQCRRVVEARAAIAAGQATSAQHRLLGLWLLQEARYDEARAHLGESEDVSLIALAGPMPESAGDLAELAAAIDLESKKTKYSSRQQRAFRSFAQHVRQRLPSGSGAAGSASETPVEVESGAALWERLPQGKWHKLLDLVALEVLRHSAQQAAEGTWTVTDDGTIVSANAAPARLELPVKIEGSYALRFACTWMEGGAVHVHVPLGEPSVLFTMGAFGDRRSGFELIDGHPLDSPENPTVVPRSQLRLVRDVALQVELHVELRPSSQQPNKVRRLTGGEDWTRMSVSVNGRVVGGADAATRHFSTAPEASLSPRSIGFLTRAACRFGNIELLRK